MVVNIHTKYGKINEWDRLRNLRIWKASRLLFTDYQIEILRKIMNFKELSKQIALNAKYFKPKEVLTLEDFKQTIAKEDFE